ncbi:MAG: hypothetical protein HC929_00140 [Leptolyngbyaceae cyanobacterium SM2_5_2]|nr:hypothetical protein [Leptolyngbyaceae cyanobacterium SM2_5_2]
MNVGVGMGDFDGFQLSVQIFFSTPAVPLQWQRVDVRNEVLKGDVHLFENLPTPLAVNRMTQALTEPVGYLATVPESAVRGLLLQSLVQQGLRLIIENDPTITLRAIQQEELMPSA